MYLEIIGRILLGMLVGFGCGLIPLALGFILGKNGGALVGIAVCTLCGALFGFLEKSAVLSVIVMIIVVLFLVVDKGGRKASSTKKTESVQAESQASDEVQVEVEAEAAVNNTVSDDAN